ncbi:MAG: hypothetical protein ACK5XN_33320, partial [Bacteroidota bacterium]
YKGKYAPKSRHLLTLASHYPEVLQAVCELMGMGAVWRQAVSMRIIETMRARLQGGKSGINCRWKRTSLS